ncbi:MAG: c-type cytochrome [Alphaproteobacteria bacterium]
MRVIATAIAMVLALGGAALAQEGDAAKGEKTFKKCKSCHTTEQGGKNKIGPNLFDIVGKPAGRNADYKYSKNLAAQAAEGLMWTEENLDTWLKNPRKFIKKSKMALKLKKESQRADVIAYLATLTE